jgi:hypothetical protein
MGQLGQTRAHRQRPRAGVSARVRVVSADIAYDEGGDGRPHVSALDVGR